MNQYELCVVAGIVIAVVGFCREFDWTLEGFIETYFDSSTFAAGLVIILVTCLAGASLH